MKRIAVMIACLIATPCFSQEYESKTELHITPQFTHQASIIVENKKTHKVYDIESGMKFKTAQDAWDWIDIYREEHPEEIILSGSVNL